MGVERIQCFVAMWLGDDESSRNEMNQLYDFVIQPALAASGIDAYRVDRDPSTDKIDDRIREKLDACDMVLVDLTHNPETGIRGSVIYEAGYAHGSEKPTIWMCREDLASNTPFDIRQFRQVRWNLRKLKAAADELTEIAAARAEEVSSRIDEDYIPNIAAKEVSAADPDEVLDDDLKALFLQIADRMEAEDQAPILLNLPANQVALFEELESRGLFSYADTSSVLGSDELMYVATRLTYKGLQLHRTLKSTLGGNP